MSRKWRSCEGENNVPIPMIEECATKIRRVTAEPLFEIRISRWGQFGPLRYEIKLLENKKPTYLMANHSSQVREWGQDGFGQLILHSPRKKLKHFFPLFSTFVRKDSDDATGTICMESFLNIRLLIKKYRQKSLIYLGTVRTFGWRDFGIIA